MIRKRSARALAGGLVVFLLLVSATAAYAAVSGRFSGTTGQHKSISLRVSHGFVTHLQFHVNDKCPSGHVYSIHDFNFPKIKINRFHQFDARFVSTTSKATVEIVGTVSRRRVKGRLSEHRVIAQEHRTCIGTTKYTVSKH